jgi:hypothetical protein
MKTNIDILIEELKKLPKDVQADQEYIVTDRIHVALQQSLQNFIWLAQIMDKLYKNNSPMYSFREIRLLLDNEIGKITEVISLKDVAEFDDKDYDIIRLKEKLRKKEKICECGHSEDSHGHNTCYANEDTCVCDGFKEEKELGGGK